jgi:aspartate/methionine/tyrosine aminotransferase
MHWAKTRSRAKFNLALSGLAAYPLSDLANHAADVFVPGQSLYGYGPLQGALAAKYHVAPECVVEAIGTSLANHLAMAALLDRGDEVIIEDPAYEPLVAVARYLGAEHKRFSRKFEDSFRLDVDEVARQLSGRTRLIVLTNLHNPSSVLTENDALKQLGALARSAGARVLLDEVYLGAMFDREQQSAFHLGREFVVTNSLTKVYGLGGLRCGWVLAEPELAQRIWRLNDLFGVSSPHPIERLSVIALENLRPIADRAERILTANRKLLHEFLDTRDDLEAVRAPFGTTCFPRLLRGDVAKLCELLREKYETSIVPGSFFGMPEHFRLGICGETENVAGGLERLGEALDELETI